MLEKRPWCSKKVFRHFADKVEQGAELATTHLFNHIEPLLVAGGECKDVQACQDDLVYEKSWVCQIVLLLAQILEQLIKVRSVRIVRDVLFTEKIVPVTQLYLHHHQRGIANELGQAVKVSFLCIV